MFRQFGAQELLIILLIVVLLFGAKKLPETARGLGRSLRIFKAETKGLTDDERPDEHPASADQRPKAESARQQITAQQDQAPARDAVSDHPATPADERQ